jgi:putative nucleotidyltransferase with HDIG domain
VNEGLREKIAAYIKDMPSLPATRPKVLELCNNPGASPADLKQVISLDPVLVGRTLQLVHAAYGGMEGPSIVRAIIMLGINTVKNLVLSAAVAENFAAEKLRGFDYEGYWRHSLRVALAARLIAQKQGIDPGLLEERFAAGLLHDIGKLPLGAALPGESPGLDHSEAGELMVREWGIGGALADAVIHHHNYREYAGKHKDLLYSIVAADYFASLRETDSSGGPCLQKPEKTVWKTLGISWKDVENFGPAVDAAIKKAQIFLGL